jgi:hypothetical protein
MVSKPLTKSELLAKYNSKTWQESFQRMLSIASLLQSCIISSDYRIPDDLNSAIALTPYGQQVVNHLKTQEKVEVKEARLQCFLVMAYSEPLVDVEATDADKVVAAISKQILARQILHPYIHGRFLYDQMADAFKEEREYLGIDDTQSLLAEGYIGVWQVDNYVTGPFGILKSSVKRNHAPSTRIPLQHCVDPSCGAVHKVRLTTDYDAPINKSYTRFFNYLERNKQEPSDWAGFLLEISDGSKKAFDDQNSSSLFYALGELLSLHELRTLVICMLNNGQAAEVRSLLENRGFKGSSEALCADLTHPQLMQLALMLSDASLLHAIDRLILIGQVRVPRGEVRRLTIHRGVRQGKWGLQPEICEFGIRFSSSASGLPILRLRRLIHEIYPIDDTVAYRQLEWLLRATPGASIEGRLEQFLRRAAPEAIVRTLILNSFDNLRKTYSELNLEIMDDHSDDLATARILWKLGFSIERSPEPHESFWRLHDSLTNLARAATASSSVDEEAISSAAGAYFKTLEGLLEDSLVYATWALHGDHIEDAYPFSFDADGSRDDAFSVLTKAAREKTSVGSEPIIFADKNTLFPLIRGFAILGELLRSLTDSKETESLLRAQIPEFVTNTKLISFPFLHRHVFLDLRPASQSRLIFDLLEFSRLLTASDICGIRNDLLHFRRSTADPTRVTDSLESVRTAVRKAEQAGIVRTQYEWSSRSSDEWGRSTVVLTGKSGQEAKFALPTPYDSIGLPDLRRDQFLFHHAIFDEPNEMLRFSSVQVSEYAQLWKTYPRRAVSPQASIAKQARSEGGDDIASYGATR